MAKRNKGNWFRWYIKSITPPYSLKDLIPIFISAILVAIFIIILGHVYAQIADNTLPSAPTAISATPQPSDNCCKVTFSFRGSTDNVGIVKYYIYSNGNFSSTVSAYGNRDDTNNGWTYLMNFGPKVTTSLTVKAVDTAGNLSSPSNAITVTSPGIPIFVSNISMVYSSSSKTGNLITTKVYVMERDPWIDAKRGILNNTPINNATVTLFITSPSGQKTSLTGITQGNATNAGTVTFKTSANEKGTYSVNITNVSATDRNEYLPHVTSKTLIVN